MFFRSVAFMTHPWHYHKTTAFCEVTCQTMLVNGKSWKLVFTDLSAVEHIQSVITNRKLTVVIANS